MGSYLAVYERDEIGESTTGINTDDGIAARRFVSPPGARVASLERVTHVGAQLRKLPKNTRAKKSRRGFPGGSAGWFGTHVVADSADLLVFESGLASLLSAVGVADEVSGFDSLCLPPLLLPVLLCP